MRHPIRIPGLLAVVLAATFPVAAPAVAQEAFPLTRLVPEGITFVTAERETAERAFLREHWARVWQAFTDSGVAGDLASLALSAMNEAQRAELERIVGEFRTAVEGVAWSRLGAKEAVYAQRLAPPLFFGDQLVGAPPDMVLLLRSDPQLTAEAYASVDRVLATALKEFGAVSGLHLSVAETEQDGLQRSSLNLLQMVPGTTPLTLDFGRKEDVLYFAFGRALPGEVVALLGGSGGPSVAASPRFRQAFADLPAPEDGLEYVDLVALRGSLDGLLSGILDAVEPPIADQIRNARRNEEAMAVHREGYALYEQGRYADALVLATRAHEMDPGDSLLLYNVGCLHALTGEPDVALDWLGRAVDAGFHAPAQIEKDPDLASLHERPEFQALVGRARGLAGGDGLAWLHFARTMLDQGLSVLGLFDYSASVHTTDGFVTYTDSVTRLRPGAADHPFHAVLMSGGAIDDFARWLPRETSAFQVTNSIDPAVFYRWLGQTVAGAGPIGQQVWTAWQGVQDQVGFQLEEDLLSWMGSQEVHATFRLDGADAWVWMSRVKDEQVAQAQLDRVLDLLPKAVQQLVQRFPPAAMLAVRTRPETAADLPGFHRVFVGMMPTPALCGIREGWLIAASSADAVRRVMDTAAGLHENLRANPEVLSRVLQPNGKAQEVKLEDHRQDADMLAGILGATSMLGSIAATAIPEPDERAKVLEVLSILGRLGPVAAAMDFHEDTASVTRFADGAWRTRTAEYYRPIQD